MGELLHPDLTEAAIDTGFSFSVVQYNAEKIHHITVHADDELNEIKKRNEQE